MTDDQRSEQLGRGIARDMNAMQHVDLGAQKAAFVRAATEPRKRKLGVLVTTVSCASALAIALLFLLRATPVGFEVSGQSGREGEDVAATNAAVPLTFADGSSLSLAAGGKLRVDKASRKAVVVRLSSGRLDAAVTHGTALRWRFDADRYSVHIVGTKFAITTDAHGVGVDVTEGAIRISVPGAADVSVVAGQRFIGHDGAYRVEAQHVEAPPTPPEPASPPPRVVENHPIPKPTPTGDWRKQLAHGQYDSAIATVKRLGLSEVTSAANARELTELADAARLARDGETAKQVFDSLRQRFPKSRETKRVPFLLGRVAMELDHEPRAAAKQFAAYISADPNGELVEEAFGREMEAWRAAGDAVSAKQTAVRYLERFPEGAYAALAHALGGP